MLWAASQRRNCRACSDQRKFSGAFRLQGCIAGPADLAGLPIGGPYPACLCHWQATDGASSTATDSAPLMGRLLSSIQSLLQPYGSENRRSMRPLHVVLRCFSNLVVTTLDACAVSAVVVSYKASEAKHPRVHGRTKERSKHFFSAVESWKIPLNPQMLGH